MTVPPLLVASHEATRTGAPRVLLELLTRARARIPMPLSIRLEVGGPLAPDLLALGDCPAAVPPAALLVNSALAADAVWQHRGIPSAIYLHEDRGAFGVLAPDTRRAIATKFDRVLCVSEAGAADAIELGVDPDRIRIVPPIVVEPARPAPETVAAVRAQLGVGPRGTLVVGCGEGGWRKGADLFVALGRHLADDPGVVLAWVGLRPLPFARQLDHDVIASGLGDRLHWVDEVGDPQAYLEAADVVVVTSRSDPQPLVPIEAALGGTPTVGFAIGGMVDLAGDGGASTVPYPDVAGLADAVRAVRRRPDHGVALVDATRRRWERRQAPEVVVPVFLDAIEPVLRPGTRG